MPKFTSYGRKFQARDTFFFRAPKGFALVSRKEIAFSIIFSITLVAARAVAKAPHPGLYACGRPGFQYNKVLNCAPKAAATSFSTPEGMGRNRI